MELKALEDIFALSKFFLRIPDYQRGYAWRNDKQNNQLDDFWNDLEDLQENQKHYTGVLTLEKVSQDIKDSWQNTDKEASNAENVFYVIDGQQRITTSVILIKVLLDSLEKDEVEWLDDETKLETIKKQYIGDKNKNGTNYYIFGYADDKLSFDFLKAEIFKDDSIGIMSYTGKQTLYTQNLLKAEEFFEEKVSSLENKKKKIEILTKLTRQFKFNVYYVDKETDVFMAFETMNNRGKPLSKLELLKNRLIYLSVKLKNDDLRVAINECWKIIYGYLGKDKENLLDEDDFLRDHWIMYYGFKDDQEAPTYDKYLLNKRFSIRRLTHKKEKQELEHITAKEIEEYIKSLKECVEHWYYLHNIEQSNYSNKIKFLLDRFKRLRYGAFKPLIMSIFVKKENEQDICTLLETIERFIFVMFMILSKRSDTGNSSIYKYTHEHFLAKKTIQQVRQNIDDLLYNDYFYIKAFEKTCDSLFDKGNGYYDWDGIRYFLYEYELHLKEKTKNTEFKVDWDNFNKDESIEHILPQTPKDKSWKEVLKGLNAKNNKNKLTHALGNLVLLSKNKNSTLQNHPFEIKKNGIDGSFIGFKNGSYAEQEINENATWGIQEIQNRTEKLIDFLFGKRWGIGLLVERLIKDGYEERGIEEVKEKLCFKVG